MSGRSSSSRIGKVGITTTLPVEVAFAAGATVVDLNNIFVGGENPAAAVAAAERAGFPANSCAWVKGLYSTCLAHDIKTLISVTEGDCSQNNALSDILKARGVATVRFSYPQTADDADALDREIAKLESYFGVTREQTEEIKKRCDQVRKYVRDLDESAWQRRNVPSRDLFLAELELTDMNGDVAAQAAKAASIAAKLCTRDDPAGAVKVPLAVVGVPTIIGNLWEIIENAGGRVVYHEIPHQFSFIDRIGKSIVDTYRHFTYAADAQTRIGEISAQCQKRGVRGIIHYVQSFCHRQLHDLLLRESVALPILTIEADRPGNTDGRTITRIEAFLEQLAD